MEKEIIINKYITDNCALYNGDCLKVMDKLIEKGVKVDAIICDPPYQVTNCVWDSIIPFNEMWERINLLIKDNGATILFGNQPFTSNLILSNIKNFKQELIWEKSRPSNSMLSKKQILRTHENICLFYKKQCTYNPQKWIIDERFRDRHSKGVENNYSYGTISMESKSRIRPLDDGTRYPMSVLSFTSVGNAVHPTQKPVALMEYLIKTYTNEGDLILDFTMGSGSTCVAARNTNRKVIGIELEKKYFDIAVSRYKDEKIIKEPKKEENKEDELKLASWKK